MQIKQPKRFSTYWLFTALVATAAFSVGSLLTAPVQAELAGLGDVTIDGTVIDNVNVFIEPLGYGVGTQPASAGDELIVGDTYIGGIFIDVAFDPGPLINDGLGVVGNEEGSYGRVSIDGFPSDWLVGETLIIGNGGTGVIDVFDSGSVQVGTTTRFEQVPSVISGSGLTTLGGLSTGIGTLNLENVASRLVTAELIVGDFGEGRITALAGAAIYSGNAVIGNSDGDDDEGNRGVGSGVVTLEDAGTRWTVGDTATPSVLTIGNGADIDSHASGTLQVRYGALAQVSDTIRINFDGTVELTDGGKIKTLPSSPTSFLSDISIVNDGVIMGDGTVEFVGSALINGDLGGGIARGFLGQIRNSDNKIIGAFNTNQREKLTFRGDLLINNGLIESIGGEMEFYAPVDNTFNGDIVARDAILRFNEGLINDGEIGLGGDTTIYGDIILGNSLVLTSNTNVLIRGNVTFNSPAIAVLTIGDDPSFLDVLGNVDINGGFLSLSYDSGGTSSVLGDSYEIITATGGVTGSFQNSVAVADGFLWDIVYTPNSIIVTNNGGTPNPMGSDFNGDGIVDLLDLQIWKDNYGRTPPPANLQPFGDADGDGDIDGADFLEWQMHAGGPPLVAASTAVPEPSSLALLLGTVVCLSCRRQ